MKFNKKSGVKTGIGVAGLISMPVLSYILFETVTGNLMKISGLLALLNILWFFLFYMAVFAVTGSSRLTIGFSSVAFYVLSLAETFVVAFRSKPIMLWDFFAFKTAMTVAGQYDYQITGSMVLCGTAVLVLNVIFWFFPIRVKGWKYRLFTAMAATFGVACGVCAFYKGVIPKLWLEVNQWALKESYEQQGFVLSSAISAKYIFVSPPEGYSADRLDTIYEEVKGSIRQNESNGDQIQPVNLICIMNESLSELKVAGEFATNEPYFPFMDSLKENTIKGSLYVPVFGSLTSNSEFEFLTGDLCQILPRNTIAYQMYVKPDTYSLVSTLKEQGYYSVAMHPYPGENWNRIQCYENMGFDVFYDETHYQDAERLRGYVSDKGDYDKIIEQVEAKENPDDRLFVFNVTMQNHGGYEGEFDNFRQTIHLTGEHEGKYPKADQYLSLMKESDNAFRYLTEYFAAKDEPTMIVMFGDHQPSVEDEFYDDIAGKPSSEVQAQERMMWYQTPYIIWTNYDIPEEKRGDMGAVSLASYTLKMANLQMTPYDQFMLELTEQLPVINFIGCYDDHGQFYLWGDALYGNYEFSPKLREYEMLVYNHSLDNKKVKELFTIPLE